MHKLGKDLGVLRRSAIGLEEWVNNLASGLLELTHYTCCLKSGRQITVGLWTRQSGDGLGEELNKCTAQAQTA